MSDAREAWTLSTPDFRRLWLAQRGADYPIDFAYTDADEQARPSDEPEPSLPPLTTPQHDALRAMTHGVVSISFAVIDARRDFDDVSHHRRVAAGWDGGEHAYVVRQQIVGDTALGGTVSITRHPASSFTREMLSAFPGDVGAGRLPQDLDVAVEWVSVVETLRTARVLPTTTATAAKAFTFESVAHCATIRIHVGSVDEGRPRSLMLAKVRDIPDDGRYLLILDDPAVAMPADSISVAKMLNRIVNVVRERHYAKDTPS